MLHKKGFFFLSVRFMAETAKIVSPHKTILHPSPEAGCSLSDGISAEDVVKLRRKYPGVPNCVLHQHYCRRKG